MKPRDVILATLAVLGVAGCNAPQPGFVVGDLKQTFQVCEGLSRYQCLFAILIPPASFSTTKQ